MTRAGKKSVAFIKKARERLNNVEDGINREKYEILAEVYAYAQDICSDDEAFAEFAQEEFFSSRRKALKKEDSLRLAMVFLQGADAGPRYDRACTYARALQPFFRDNVDSDEIADLIEESGGVEKLYRAVVEREQYEDLGLQIEANSDQLDVVLETDIDDERTVTIKRVEDGKRGWKRFIIVKIDEDA